MIVPAINSSCTQIKHTPLTQPLSLALYGVLKLLPLSTFETILSHVVAGIDACNSLSVKGFYCSVPEIS